MVLSAFLVVVSIWAFQDSVLLKARPRYFDLLFQLNVVDVVRCADGFTLVGNSDQFAFVFLSGLKCICQFVSQSCSLLRSFCRGSASSSVLMWRYNRQSSKKRRALALTLDGRSLM